MKLRKELVEIFGRCSRLLNKIALNAGDEFFSQLCIKESDKLMSDFVFFLRGEGEKRGSYVAQNDILQHKNVAKYSQIVQREYHVAQCCQPLISQIKNILNLLEILKHLGLAKSPTSLLLERDLLLLKLSVLDVFRPTAVSFGKTGKSVVLNPTETKKFGICSSPVLGKAHKEILEFIRSKEEVQNLEIFSRFAHITRRTLKKKLSDLIKVGVIKRSADGKKVFYSNSSFEP